MSKNDNLQLIQTKLESELDRTRFQHTLGVMYTAAALAMVYGIDLTAAQTAGLLHDCAKCIPNGKKLTLCQKYTIPVSPYEKNNPFMLHAKLGAYLAEYKYQVNDPAILSSIRWHTTGKPAMSILDKIVYIADYIEPARNLAPDLDKIRRTAFQNLDECMYLILKDVLAYLQMKNREIDDMSMDAFAYYRDLHNQIEREEE